MSNKARNLDAILRDDFNAFIRKTFHHVNPSATAAREI